MNRALREGCIVMKIIANLATYPPRRAGLEQVVRGLAPQVDRLNLVLNQYDAPLPELADIANLEQILPHEDTKDAGKFYPEVGDADWVFFVDDDIPYPADFVERSIEHMTALPAGRWLGGYHASIYRQPSLLSRIRKIVKMLRNGRKMPAYDRTVFHYRAGLDLPIQVDQIGSGTAVMAARHAPPYEYMRDSQKFVDVRLARWCFEQGITPVCLPRKDGWLASIDYEETIWTGFTSKNHAHVTDEILTFAFSRPNVGTTVSVSGSRA